MATTEMMVVRKLPRNTKRTMMTNTAPSSRARPTLCTDVEMKSAWRNTCVSRCTSAGKDFCISCRLRSICSVTSSVLMLGCLDIDRMTAGRPLREAMPMCTALPMRTCATSPTVTGCGPVFLSSVEAMSARSLVRPMPRRAYSLPYSRTTPPVLFWLIPSTAAASSSIVTP